MSSVSIIIPIFNPSGDRFNNFCFILKKLYELIDSCEVVVVEQTSDNSNIQRFLQKFPKTKHISVDAGPTFNKSKLINQGVTQVDSEYIWMIDGDFYTDYAYVFANMGEFADFTRPFVKTIMLTEEETESLQELSYITIDRDEYKTNSADGKFSFIIKRSVFIESGMLNEDFIGWGFQDLDFVENRLIKCEKSYIDVMAFHLYHRPASKKYVNRNKRLYLNISYDESVDESKHERVEVRENQHDRTETLSVLPKVEERVIQEISIQTEVEDILQRPEPRKDTTLVYQKVRPSSIFPLLDNTIILDESNKKTRGRDITGRIKTLSDAPHYMNSYLNFIIKHYYALEGIYIFTTDLFSTSSSIFGHAEVKKVVKCVENGFLDFDGFSWITPTTSLRVKKGHCNVVDKKSKYDYDKWIQLYTKTEPKRSPKYSLAGSFAVDSEHIKKHKVEYYERILVQSPSWVEEDYLFFMSSLGNIFA